MPLSTIITKICYVISKILTGTKLDRYTMTDSDTESRCSYTFDPEARSVRGDGSSLDFLDDGDWQCPHTPCEDHDRCPFHLPPEDTPEGVVERRFSEAISRPGKRPKQFIGARLKNLNLERTVVECADNHPVDMRYATFTGTTTLEYAIVRQPLNLEATTFEGRAECTEARFENEVYLSRANFEEQARFFGTRFTQGVWCYRTAFEQADFHRSRFGGPADFTDARFGQCHFPDVVFTAPAEFDGATFEHASFPAVQFRDDASFDEVTLPERVTFRNCEFDSVASFETPVPLDSSTCLDLRNTTLTAGRLVPPRAVVIFDLQGATVGTVTITEGCLLPDLFDRFRFLNTTFNGFDFGAYREALSETAWEIHHAKDVPGLESPSPSAGELEGTYLKAKNGANAIGDTKAAAEFFRKEMLFRRRQYVHKMQSGSVRRRTVALWRWIANALLDATAGYGERPSRVVASAVAVVLLFTLLFSVTKPTQPYGSSAGYLILSLESFITLVLGGAERIDDPQVRLLANVEGFIGAFLIALFVFTLTRSIHR